MGVIFGFDRSTGHGVFIPIERIYAESLLQGYDWVTNELRPVPALDDPLQEELGLDSTGWSIVATFLDDDFGHGLGTKYEAVLHRVGGGGALVPVVADRGNPYTVEISHSNPIARFDVLNIPSDQRSGEFRVKVRMCPYEIGVAPNTNTCSGYGSDGGASIDLPPGPQNFRKTGSGSDQVELSWDLVADTTGYEFDYREQGTTDWLSVSRSVVTSPTSITGLSCGTTYKFIVRAFGDGSPYDMTWGFWYNIRFLFRILPQHTVALTCAKALELPQNGFLRGNQAYMRNGKPTHRSYLIHDDDYGIVVRYQSEYRGVVQYYLLAYNVHHFGRLHKVMEMSLARTLAAKHKSTTRKMRRKYKSVVETEHGPRVCLRVIKQRDNGKRPLVAQFGGIPLKRQRQAVLVDQQPQRYRANRTELIKRLLAEECEMCGSTVAVEVHHIRALRDLNVKGRREKPKWVQIMATRKRITLVVCRTCHMDIHHGRINPQTQT